MVKIFRQGDVVIREEAAPDLKGIYLSEPGGEVRMTGETGQAHVVKGTSLLHMADGRTLVQIQEGKQGTVTHPEHGRLVLPSGVYSVDRVRTYSGGQTRAATD